MRKSLRNRYWGRLGLLCLLLGFVTPVYGQAYLEHYNPKEGFSPANKGLSKIMLKIAGSLEHHGSPEPYLRWMLEEEHPRIAAKWKKATGSDRTSRPEYLTEEYSKKLLGGWKGIEESLKLQKLCRESGRNMRYAIDGSWNKPPEEWTAEETALTEAERKQYQAFLKKKFFTPAEFKTMEVFYEDGGGHDKLSDAGKAQMSSRYWLGKMPAEKREAELASKKGGTDLINYFNDFQNRFVANISEGGERRIDSDLLEKELIARLRLDQDQVDMSKIEWLVSDAVKYSHLIKEGFAKRFAHVKKTASPKDAIWTETQMTAMAETLLILAYSELEAAIYESIADERLKKK